MLKLGDENPKADTISRVWWGGSAVKLDSVSLPIVDVNVIKFSWGLGR